MLPLIFALGCISAGVYLKNYYEDIETINLRYQEILKWTKKYAATEKISEDDINIDIKTIDKLLKIALEKDLKNYEITEELYRMIYEIYVNKKLEEAN
jgi:hypothetical protein